MDDRSISVGYGGDGPVDRRASRPAFLEGGRSVSAIRTRGLSKTYRLYRHPSHRLKELFFRRDCHDRVDVLSGVDLLVERGEGFGIIGDNGAGKSTFLKIVAGTLAPTMGEIEVNGRVAALLELGAGFHPEFTGRQNIYLNASLLGMTRDEIAARESEIISFSELDEYIDRPVKTYSSGMHVRLAFSIATCIDPDILIIDEALSVGDQAFQKKCIERMLRFRDEGKTMLFCSHSMYMVNQLCDRAMWLHKGRVRMVGEAVEVTAAYEDYVREKTAGPATEEAETVRAAETESPVIYVESIELNGVDREVSIDTGAPLSVKISVHSHTSDPYWIVAGIRRNDDLVCHGASQATHEGGEPMRGPGKGVVELYYPSIPFLHGTFYVVVFVVDESGLHVYDKRESEAFKIVPPRQWNQEMGLLALECRWRRL